MTAHRSKKNEKCRSQMTESQRQTAESSAYRDEDENVHIQR